MLLPTALHAEGVVVPIVRQRHTSPLPSRTHNAQAPTLRRTTVAKEPLAVRGARQNYGRRRSRWGACDRMAVGGLERVRKEGREGSCVGKGAHGAW